MLTKSILILLAFTIIILAAPARSGDALGLYFSDSEFNQDSATVMLEPDLAVMAYIVLTEPTGDVVAGYEVGIACTDPDFIYFAPSLIWENDGTDTNQIVHFVEPKPVLPGGTVLSSGFLSVQSTDEELVTFGPSDPSSIDEPRPAVEYVAVGWMACDGPFGSDVVAWLNPNPVATAPTSWSGVKGLFE